MGTNVWTSAAQTVLDKTGPVIMSPALVMKVANLDTTGTNVYRNAPQSVPDLKTNVTVTITPVSLVATLDFMEVVVEVSAALTVVEIKRVIKKAEHVIAAAQGVME